jgi:L-2,4-diaminobutyrate decarboxylase
MLLYGGSTYKRKSRSDIDILFYLENPDEDQKKIYTFIKSLHTKYKLAIDDEIPLKNKLIYDNSDMVNAIHLSCFNINSSPDKIISKILKTKKFLSSYEMKLRLLINAATTPNIVFGNIGLAKTFTTDICNSLTILAILLQEKPKFTLEDLYDSLTISNANEIGENYLGYKTDYPEVSIKLKSILLDGLFALESKQLITKNGSHYFRNKTKDELIKSATMLHSNDRRNYILNNDNADYSREIFSEAIDIGMNFKLKNRVRDEEIDSKKQTELMLERIPTNGKNMDDLIGEFKKEILPHCYNFSSPRFMGFPDAGNSVAGITGSIISDFMQQNLINQSFCSPSGTPTEIAVLRWLREIVGYSNSKSVESIFDVGGIITSGGTSSNASAVLLARENYISSTMTDGVKSNDDNYYFVIPEGIGHYSIKSSQMWAGCGSKLLEVPTINYRYDLKELRKTLIENKGRIMGLVAYVGDSRTMTIDSLDEIADLANEIDPKIWLHADACHGFSLGLSSKLRHRIKGIERFDSITTDPHKVMNIPYTVSALLVKNPANLKKIASTSDLIMKEQYAFGQITPFIGSKPWLSLKIWFAMKHIGLKGFEDIINKRHSMALKLQQLIDESSDFITINRVQINSVAFMYVGNGNKRSVELINKINIKMHEEIIKEGDYHLHQFSIRDNGAISKGEIIYPHRYMSGNPNIGENDLVDLLNYLRSIAKKVEKSSDRFSK